MQVTPIHENTDANGHSRLQILPLCGTQLLSALEVNVAIKPLTMSLADFLENINCGLDVKRQLNEQRHQLAEARTTINQLRAEVQDENADQ